MAQEKNIKIDKEAHKKLKTYVIEGNHKNFSEAIKKALSKGEKNGLH